MTWRTSMAPSAPGVGVYGYDAAGRLDTLAGPDGATTFAYRPDSLTDRVVRPNGVTTGYGYVVDGAGNRTDTATTSPAGATTETYSYDPAGQLVGYTDAADAATSYRYDAAGNRTEVTGPAGRTFYGFVAATRVTRPVSMTAPGT